MIIPNIWENKTDVPNHQPVIPVKAPFGHREPVNLPNSPPFCLVNISMNAKSSNWRPIFSVENPMCSTKYIILHRNPPSCPPQSPFFLRTSRYFSVGIYGFPSKSPCFSIFPSQISHFSLEIPMKIPKFPIFPSNFPQFSHVSIGNPQENLSKDRPKSAPRCDPISGKCVPSSEAARASPGTGWDELDCYDYYGNSYWMIIIIIIIAI